MGDAARAFDAVAEQLQEPAPRKRKKIRRDQTDSIKELAGALAKAQAEIRGASKDAVNPGFRSRYATLSAVWDACRRQLTSNGLSVAQMPRMIDGRLMLETRLMHVSGQWLSSWWPINPVKNDPQGLGSALTYARRYALSAMVGVAPDDDDDGQAASQAPAARPARPKSQSSAPVSSGLEIILRTITAAGSKEDLEAKAKEIAEVANTLDGTEVAAAQEAYRQRVKALESKDRAAAQREQIRAGMRKEG